MIHKPCNCNTHQNTHFSLKISVVNCTCIIFKQQTVHHDQSTSKVFSPAVQSIYLLYKLWPLHSCLIPNTGEQHSALYTGMCTVLTYFVCYMYSKQNLCSVMTCQNHDLLCSNLLGFNAHYIKASKIHETT